MALEEDRDVFLYKIVNPVGSIYISGKFIKEYESSYYTRHDGFDPSCVNKICRVAEGRKQHKGFTFKFKYNA